jgi:hypothetical protein
MTGYDEDDFPQRRKIIDKTLPLGSDAFDKK